MPQPHIVIVGADKGGVGKTFISRALVDFCISKNLAWRAFGHRGARRSAETLLS
jgi:dethiobiotin synthetase